MVQAPGRGRSAVPARLHPPWPSLCFRKAEPAGEWGPISQPPQEEAGRQLLQPRREGSSIRSLERLPPSRPEGGGRFISRPALQPHRDARAMVAVTVSLSHPSPINASGQPLGTHLYCRKLFRFDGFVNKRNHLLHTNKQFQYLTEDYLT